MSSQETVSPPDWQRSASNGEGMRVLLVEDDPKIGQAVREALRDASQAADWVSNGQAALDALACQDYDIVLLGLGLPGKSGCWRRERDNPVPSSVH